jgi:ADP-ribosylation factor family
LNIWDVGGQKTIRSYWRNYFEQTDGLVWVVDSSDVRRLEDCKAELHNLLKEEVWLTLFESGYQVENFVGPILITLNFVYYATWQTLPPTQNLMLGYFRRLCCVRDLCNPDMHY